MVLFIAVLSVLNLATVCFDSANELSTHISLLDSNDRLFSADIPDIEYDRNLCNSFVKNRCWQWPIASSSQIFIL